MIEWANYWARGITYRREHNQDVGGFFAQVGQLYVVYHIWAYKNLVNRKFIREHTWSKPGWDSTVENTGMMLFNVFVQGWIWIKFYIEIMQILFNLI